MAIIGFNRGAGGCHLEGGVLNAGNVICLSTCQIKERVNSLSLGVRGGGKRSVGCNSTARKVFGAQCLNETAAAATYFSYMCRFFFLNFVKDGILSIPTTLTVA